MAVEWPLVTIGELAESISDTHNLGKDHLIFLNTSDVLLGKILHNSYSAVRDWPGQAKKAIRRNDILFSEIRPANGRWAYVDVDAEDFVVSTKLMVIRSRLDKVVPRFLYHFLTSPDTTKWLQHLAESRSGTFPQITFDQVAELELALPPMSAQKAIADFFDGIEDKIKLNRQMNETLETMVQVLFKSWFVDFDPVRAKAEGHTTGLPKHIADLFPNSFEDSLLGEIPKGWEVNSLSTLSDINYGKNLPFTQLLDRGFPVYGAAGIVGYFSEAMFDFPVVLVTSRGSGSGTVHETFEPAFITNNSFTIVPKDTWFSRHFLRLWLKSVDILARVTGSAQPQLTITNLHDLKMLKPSRQILEMFNALVDALWETSKSKRNESHTLAALRDTLLPKLLSGEIRIKKNEQSTGAGD